jgi:hypothetical protein
MAITASEQCIIKIEQLKTELGRIPLADITLCKSRSLQTAIIAAQGLLIEILSREIADLSEEDQ